MRCARLLIISSLFSLCLRTLAAEDENSEAYWDYGVGLGAVHYEHYPASDQFSDLALPAPTFQYRGKILRADDREGAHLYLLKGSDLTLEISGVGFPALDSSNNEARQGMDNLPWMIALGPQLVWRHFTNIELGFGAYQVVTTNFAMTRFQGGIFEGRATYTYDWEWLNSQSKIFASAKWATAELQELYYSVPSDKVMAGRAAYSANDGLLSHDFTYYQNYKVGRWTWAAGISVGLYSQAANHDSPLHKSDTNWTGFAGLNYVLGESKKPAVPQEDTSGLINNIRQRQELRDGL